MDFPKTSWLLCDTATPHPLAPEQSSRIVPLFALYSDGAHGGSGSGEGFSGSLGTFAHLWFLLLSFHTKFWLPKLTTSKTELTTTLQSWPPVVIHSGPPGLRAESLVLLPYLHLPPGPSCLYSSQLLFHQALFIPPLRCGASIHRSPSLRPITTHRLGLHSCLQPDISRGQLCPRHGDPGQVMALSGSVSSPSKGLTPPWLPVQWTPQAQCCCEVTDGETPGRCRASTKRARQASRRGSNRANCHMQTQQHGPAEWCHMGMWVQHCQIC